MTKPIRVSKSSSPPAVVAKQDVYKQTNMPCPSCGVSLVSEYVDRDGVYFYEATCCTCGTFSTKLGSKEDVDYFLDKDVNELDSPCCVVLEITDDCDMHCPICYADSNCTNNSDNSQGPSTDNKSVARTIDLKQEIKQLFDLGEPGLPFNLQISGGEPTTRDDLCELVSYAKNLGFTYIQLNTNGLRLSKDENLAHSLKQGGLSAIFLQFDSTEDASYMSLRGQALFDIKKRAIENCRRARLPVALVPTVTRGVNLDKCADIVRFAMANIDIVKGVHFQPITMVGRTNLDIRSRPSPSQDSHRVSMWDVIHELEKANIGDLDILSLGPISTGHPLCCFTGVFLKDKNGRLQSIKSDCDGCCSPDISLCEADSHFAEDRLLAISRDRNFVARHWQVDEACSSNLCECESGSENGSATSFDKFLKDYRANQLTISAMPFMDKLTFDDKRARRCRVNIFKNGRLQTFCGYNAYRRPDER